MKLLVVCLLAVCCCSLVRTSVNEQSWRRLEEIRQHLKNVKDELQKNNGMLHTPPQNIEDCCSLSALQCYRENLETHFNKDKKTLRLISGLKKPATEQSFNFCYSSNTTVSPCQACVLHPKENAVVFFSRLETLLQMAMDRMNKK